MAALTNAELAQVLHSLRCMVVEEILAVRPASPDQTAASVARAVRLPQTVLCQWVELAPPVHVTVLHFQHVMLTRQEWTRLAASLDRAKIAPLNTSLHWSVSHQQDAGDYLHTHSAANMNASWPMLCTLCDVWPELTHHLHLDLHKIFIFAQSECCQNFTALGERYNRQGRKAYLCT